LKDNKAALPAAEEVQKIIWKHEDLINIKKGGIL